MGFGVYDVTQLEHRCTLGAQTTLVDRMIGIAFQVDKLTITHRAKGATTTCAVAADVRVLFGVNELPLGGGFHCQSR